jgi:hypothetical protein
VVGIGLAPAGGRPIMAGDGHGRLPTSAAYRAPEELTGADQGGFASDVFSVGVVLYEALSGRLPYRAGSYGAARNALVGYHLEPLSRVRHVPRLLDEVVSRALARIPSERFANGRALQRAVNQLLAERALLRDVSAPQGPRAVSEWSGTVGTAQDTAVRMAVGPTVVDFSPLGLEPAAQGPDTVISESPTDNSAFGCVDTVISEMPPGDGAPGCADTVISEMPLGNSPPTNEHCAPSRPPAAGPSLSSGESGEHWADLPAVHPSVGEEHPADLPAAPTVVSQAEPPPPEAYVVPAPKTLGGHVAEGPGRSPGPVFQWPQGVPAVDSMASGGNGSRPPGPPDSSSASPGGEVLSPGTRQTIAALGAATGQATPASGDTAATSADRKSSSLPSFASAVQVSRLPQMGRLSNQAEAWRRGGRVLLQRWSLLSPRQRTKIYVVGAAVAVVVVLCLLWLAWPSGHRDAVTSRDSSAFVERPGERPVEAPAERSAESSAADSFVQRPVDESMDRPLDRPERTATAAPETAVLRLQGVPLRAKVIVDGQRRAGVNLTLPVGREYHLRVVARGYSPWTTTVLLNGDHAMEVELVPQRRAKARSRPRAKAAAQPRATVEEAPQVQAEERPGVEETSSKAVPRVPVKPPPLFRQPGF